MKAVVYNQKAENIGEVDLNPAIFAVKPSLHLLAEAVRVQQSNARKGLSHTKTRAEVSGGGKKPWKQKGTGRARVGSIRSPIWRHGGITFGPRSDRNWELKLNKKAKKKALFMALSDKAIHNQVVLVDNLHFDNVKTKEFNVVLKAFEKGVKEFGKKVLFVLPKANKDLARVTQNLQNINTVLASSLNIVDTMKADTIFALKDSLKVIEKTFLKKELES